MYSIHSSGRVGLLESRVGVSDFGAAADSAFILAIIFNVEVSKTETSFLKISDSCWSNSSKYNSYSI